MTISLPRICILLLCLLGTVGQLAAEKLRFGNPRRQSCRGLGICTWRANCEACDADAALKINGNTLVITFLTLPKSSQSQETRKETTFVVASDYPVGNPGQYGYKSLTILKGDYPFNWKSKEVTVKFKGERVGRHPDTKE